MNDKSQLDLCFLDLETTGALFSFHEVIEAALIRTSPDCKNIIDVVEIRVTPEHPERLTSEAQAVNGFVAENWLPTHASTRAAWEEFYGILQGTVLVAHNASFDRAFLEEALRRSGIASSAPRNWVGTESLAWPFVISGQLASPRLEDICPFLGIPHEPFPHRARGGAKMTYQVYGGLMTLLLGAQRSESVRAERPPARLVAASG